MGRFSSLRARAGLALLVCVAALAGAACDGGGLPVGWRTSPPGGGPQIRWDLNAEPVADIPLPNDIATWPDPTSPTGLRLNPSQIVDTAIEGDSRENLAQLDGWGTYAPITIPIDGDLDVADFYRRQGGRDAFTKARFRQHAIYVVDLETGTPVPLDVNGGNFPYVLPDPSSFYDNDPRAGESNAVFETVDEDSNHNGLLDPGEDGDFDGVLDRPNTFTGTRTSDPYSGLDDMMWFYERQTGTLYLKPILPMQPERRYAVVVTDRLSGPGGPVRSPFESVHPLAQKDALRPLPAIFAAHPDVYGDLATRGWDGVAFAWSFTTESTTRDLDTLREGLYGRGPMAWLADQFPPQAMPARMQGPAPRITCTPTDNVYVAPGDNFRSSLASLLASPAFDLDEARAQKVLDSYQSLDHLAIMFFETPYLLGDPDHPSLYDSWDIDAMNGRATVGRETISALVFVPKATATHAQPFRTIFYVHGHGSANAEAIPFAGYLMQHGIAAVFVNANGHGVPIDPVLQLAVEGILGTDCLAPAAKAILAGRARDLNGDRSLDSGANFWTAYAFHTRDEVRQTILDHVRAVQILRSFDGTRRWPTDVSYTHRQLTQPLTFDGHVRTGDTGPVGALGDFDGDGTPDLGGPAQEYYFTGGSLGGITTGVMAGVEPAVNAAVPIVGGGGLSDIAVRTSNGSVRKTMHLRMVSPLVYTQPSAGPSSDTACAAGEISLRIRAVELDDDPVLEFACVGPDLLDGDDVLVVRNHRNHVVRCAGATGGTAGRYRVGIPSNVGDGWTVEIYRDALMQTDFATCAISGSPRPATTIDKFLVGHSVGMDDNVHCARFRDIQCDVDDPLVAPATGLGYQRQSPDVRRALFSAQLGMEAGDPINYARRIFLDPVTAPDVPVRPRNVFVANSVGDTNVCLNVGTAYARAAGIMPFVPYDGPDELANWRAPRSFESRYPGLRTPNDVLINYHVLEGVARLDRHPTVDAPGFLFDVDDLSDGRMLFSPDGNHQAADGIAPPRLDMPLRWVRESRPMLAPTDDAVWDVGPGENVSAALDYYVIPDGIHGFDEIIYPVDAPFDLSQYVINLIARYVSTSGTDVRYHTDPMGHLCLEDSSCDFLQELRRTP